MSSLNKKSADVLVDPLLLRSDRFVQLIFSIPQRSLDAVEEKTPTGDSKTTFDIQMLAIVKGNSLYRVDLCVLLIPPTSNNDIGNGDSSYFRRFSTP